MPRRSWASRQLSLAALLLVTTPLRANGRFPETNQLVVEPGNPDHVIVRATFGLLVTRDRGASWGLVCEDAFGVQNTDPPLAVLPGGVVLLGLARGVSRSDASGCSFELAAGIEGGVTDVTASLGEPGTALALTVGDRASRVWISTDSGAVFEPAATLAGLSAVTLDVAPSEPDVWYVSGVSGEDGVLYRSRDRGASFESFPIPGASGARVPYIAAIDAQDADTVYIRTYAIPSLLLQSRDGGRSFSTQPFEMRTPIQGLALSEDGSMILASNPFDGTFRADRELFAFEQVRCGGASCLGFAAQDLLGCGSESLDGFVIGVSRDHGASFSRLLSQTCVPGPVACPEASGVARSCTTTWPALQTRLGAERCEPVDVATDTACFGGGGASSAPAPTGGDASDASAATPTASAGSAHTGCACGVGAPNRAPVPALCVVALLLVRKVRIRQRFRAVRN